MKMFTKSCEAMNVCAGQVIPFCRSLLLWGHTSPQKCLAQIGLSVMKKRKGKKHRTSLPIRNYYTPLFLLLLTSSFIFQVCWADVNEFFCSYLKEAGPEQASLQHSKILALICQGLLYFYYFRDDGTSPPPLLASTSGLYFISCLNKITQSNKSRAWHSLCMLSHN